MRATFGNASLRKANVKGDPHYQKGEWKGNARSEEPWCHLPGFAFKEAKEVKEVAKNKAYMMNQQKVLKAKSSEITSFTRLYSRLKPSIRSQLNKKEKMKRFDI